jgi:hypothetical protein
MYKFGGLIHSFLKFAIKGHILTKIEYELKTWFHCNFSYIKNIYTGIHTMRNTQPVFDTNVEKNINIKT